MARAGAGLLTMQTAGFARLYNALGGLIEAAEKQSDWWVGTIVVYSAHLEFGTRFMSARPYFQPAILETAREVVGATPRTIGSSAARKSGRSIWGIMVGAENEDGDLAAKIAKTLERKTKEKITQKGLVDTGHLRNSIVAAPTLPKLRIESFSSMETEAVSRSTGESVGRDEIVDR